MLGSLQDAEDLVQETLLRAWRRLHTFQQNVSFRAWLYRIATNACLDMLGASPKRRERMLPAAAYPPADPREMFAPPATDAIWLEPLPDDLLDETATSPEAHYILRESISLAFLVALQSLPTHQRAILIMRDVLDFSANEAAAILNLTVSAANSALHRARVTMSKHYHNYGRDSLTGQGVNEATYALLERYVDAWETGDVGKLVTLLNDDATLSMPPSPSWYFGRDQIHAFLETFPFSGQASGRWRLQAASANAQPAFDLYGLDPSIGSYLPVGVQVLTVNQEQIAEICIFLKPEFFTRLLPAWSDS
jgi:RNA polymerase sigma-70 factor (ECF subfamily)